MKNRVTQQENNSPISTPPKVNEYTIETIIKMAGKKSPFFKFNRLNL